MMLSDRGRNAGLVDVSGERDAEIGDAEDVRDRQADKTETAPEQEAFTDVLISAEEKAGTQQSCEQCEDIERHRHQSRSFLKRKARANSRT